MKKRIKVFVGRSKDSNWELAEKIGIDLNTAAVSEFSHLATEVELIVDVDTVSGRHEIVACDGKFLGDELVSSGEVEVCE